MSFVYVYGYLKYGHKFGVSGHIDSEFVVKKETADKNLSA